jgi:hypothetical protein
MRSVIARLCGVGVAIVSGFLMYFAVMIRSLPLDSGETRWWMPVLETVLFAPTIWVTKPIHQALYLSGHYSVIPWLTFAEIGLLAILYGVLVHQAIMGKLAPRKVAAWFSRRKLLVGGIVVVMIFGSIVGRVATARQDFRKEASVDGAAVSVVPVVEISDVQVSVLETTTVAFPEGSEPVAALRNRGEPVSVLVTGNVQQDASNFMSSTADLALLQLDGDRWIVRNRLEGVQMSAVSHDFRSPSDPSSPGVLFLNVTPGNPQLMVPFSDTNQVYSFTPYVDSQAGFAVEDSIWVVGLGFNWQEWDGPSVERISAYDHPNFTSHSVGVFLLDTATGAIELKGVCDNFTSHSIETLDATLDEEGVLHMVAAEVLVENENSLRIHHLRFDTNTSRWLGDDVRWGSDVFTSSVDTLLRQSSSGIEMFWNLSRSPEVETGGVFACASGDPRVVRLTDHEDSFLAALADPHPGIEIVVGRVDPGYQSDRTPGLSQQERFMRTMQANREAMNDTEMTVEWYVRRSGEWLIAGTTTVPSRLYDPGVGQTGFWLWPGDNGRLFAAFLAQNSMIVQELALGSGPGR